MDGNRLIREGGDPPPPVRGEFHTLHVHAAARAYHHDPSAVPCPAQCPSDRRGHSPLVVLGYVDPATGAGAVPVEPYDALLYCTVCKRRARVEVRA